MSVPTYDKCMLPPPRICSCDGQEHLIREAISVLADYFQLTDVDRSERRIPAGENIGSISVQWANTYLGEGRGYFKSVRRGVFQITKRGREFFGYKPVLHRCGCAYALSSVPWNSKHHPSGLLQGQGETKPERQKEETPRETIESSYMTFRQGLAQDLLDAIMDNDPAFFEQLVVDLIKAMGYGGPVKDAGKVVGGPGDGGVDGIINEDKLGLDVIYIQAKRYGVGPEVVGQERQWIASPGVCCGLRRVAKGNYGSYDLALLEGRDCASQGLQATENRSD